MLRLIGDRSSRFTCQALWMDLNNPNNDFVSMAKMFGTAAERVTDLRELERILPERRKVNKPWFIDVVTGPAF